LSYAEKHLIAGEIVQYETRLHWIVMLGHTLIAAVLALVGVSLLITPWRVVYRGEAASGPLRWAGVACVVIAAIFSELVLCAAARRRWPSPIKSHRKVWGSHIAVLSSFFCQESKASPSRSLRWEGSWATEQ